MPSVPPAPAWSGQGSAATSPPTPTGRAVVIGLGLLLLLILIVGGFVVWVFSLVGNSPVTAEAVAMAARDRRVNGLTGLPLRRGRFVSGHVNLQADGTGDATLTIPVSGPQGKGNVYAVETRSGGVWTATTLEFWPAKDPNAIVRMVEPGSGER